MSQVRSIVYKLVEEAKKELFTNLMMVDKNADRKGQMLAINWESIVDKIRVRGSRSLLLM